MLTFVNVVITEPISDQLVFLFMQEMLQQKEKIHEIDAKKEKHDTSDEAKINEVLYRYFVWFTNNSIEEVQTFYKFWNQRVTDQLSISLRQDKMIN